MAAVLADPFVVALRELRDVHGVRRHEVRRGWLLEEVAADVDSRVPPGAEAVADVVLEAFDGGVSVSGRVSAPWQGECRRCLASINGELDVEVRELFRRGGSQEEGTYPINEDHLSLRELVVDALFVGLPLLPLCRDDCRGICAHCGADRNVEDCGCAETEVDPRWAGLRALADADAAQFEDGTILP
jgi:uncharacterized protein